MSDELHATLRASAPRRWFGVALLVSLGALLLHSGLLDPPESFFWRAVLVAVAVLTFAGAQRMWRATAHGVVLSPEGLMSTDGESIAAMEDIEGVERGIFAFKPSNGFLVRLKTSQAPKWQPGLWWRYGQRVGVGGMTPAAQAKVMADLLATHLAERDARPR
jgi:hypothetical protein